MNRILLLITFIVLGCSINSFAQKKISPPVIVCPADYNHSDLRIPPPEQFRKSIANARSAATVKTADIRVTYHGFSESPEAQNAFQYAVDIWSTLIKSNVPIYIDATFKTLSTGVLGSAGTTGLYRGFEGAPDDSTWYNVALAEKMANRDLNKPGEPDISASFGNTFDWYYGTDQNTPSGTHDFVTVVLHEIGHGLGFFALNGYDETAKTGTRSSGAYDNYIVNGDGVAIFNVPNSSVELGTYYTSNNLFINAPLAISSNNTSAPKIYTPSTYNSGSSISHWDEVTFNGTINALQTPQIGSGESIHDPGPNMMSLFANMGWVHTYLNHQPDLIVDNLIDNILININIASDTTLAIEQPTLHYSFDGFVTQTNQIMNVDGNGLFSFSIPNPGVPSTMEYYISGVSDVLGRNYTSPSKIGATHKTIIQNLNVVSLPYSLANGGDFENQSEFIQLPFKGNTSIWEQGIPTNKLNTPSSGTAVWKTDLDANIRKPSADFSSILITPKFNLADTTADYNLKFDLSMDIDIDSAIAGLSVVYSVDGGLNWLDLGKPNDGRGINWMNISDEYLLFESGNAWVLNNTQNAPQTVSYNLSEIIQNGEPEVYFGLVASVTNVYNDAIYVFDGIMIDNFEITKTEPRAYFSVFGSEVNFPGDQIQFNYISKGAETYSWDFGDGQFSNQKNPIHTYQTGGTFDVTLSITYPGGIHSHTETSVVNVVVSKGSTYTLQEGGDMESNFSDFLAENISGTPFERGSSTISGKSGASSGTNAWVTGITAAEYKNRSEAYLYTPIFDFSLLGSYELSFKANYSFETGWDGFILEYSLDYGTNWLQVNPVVATNWYDLIGENNVAQGWPAIPLFSGTTNNNFNIKSVDLSDLGGNTGVAFRFHFKSDYAAIDVGMALDDFILTGPIAGSAVPSFTFAGNTGCDGQMVTFTNTSTGSISSLNWDFGANATPATGTGTGPFVVTYSGTGKSTVTLTAVSPVNGTQVISKIDSISTAPTHIPTYIEEPVLGNETQTNLVASTGEAFQWHLNNSPILGATNQTYVATGSGSYSVDVTVNGCLGNSGNNIIITALDNQLFGQSIFVYPNPASEKLNLDISNNYYGLLKVKIYDIKGVLFYSKTDIKESKDYIREIDVSSFESGIYFVELQIDNQRETRKLILK